MDSNEKVVKLKELHFKITEVKNYLKSNNGEIMILKVDDPIMERAIYKIK